MESVGRGTGIVIATGTQTEFGVIFSMMQDVCGTSTWTLDLADFVLGGREANTTATQYGRAGKEAFHNIFCGDWGDMSHRRPTRTIMA